MKSEMQLKSMRKWLGWVAFLVSFSMFITPVFAITGENYDTDVQCGSFECSDYTSYWYEAGLSEPDRISTNCYSGTFCYQFYTGGVVTTSQLRSWEDGNNWYAYYIGENTTIEYFANFSANYTGSGNWNVRLYDPEDLNVYYLIDRFLPAANLTANWTSRRWMNDVNDSVPYGYYLLRFLHIDSSAYAWLDNVTVGDTSARVWNYTVGISSETEVDNVTGCPLQLNDSTVTFGSETVQTNATRFEENCCYVASGWYGCWLYEFLSVDEGTLHLTVEHEGYADYETDVLLDTNMGSNVWMSLLGIEQSLDVYVRNSTGDYLVNAKGTLYFANGSIFESTSMWNLNPIWSSSAGLLRWLSLPADSYFYTVDRDGYERYTSPIFYLGEDREFTITLGATSRLIILTVDETVGTTADTFNFTINLTGLTTPIYNAHYYIKTETQEDLPYLIHIREDNQNFTIYAKDYFDDGINIVHMETAEGVISNFIEIEITDIYGGEIVGTPMMDMPFAAAGWVGLLFTPFSIITMFLVGIGAYFENMVKDAKGAIFLSVIIIGVLAFTYLGLYPAWIGVLIIIVCALILSKFVLKVTG